MDLSNCETLKSKMEWSKFLIDNPKYATAKEILDEKANFASLQSQYNSSGCGVNLVKDKCASLDNQIIFLTNLIGTQGILAVTDNRIYSQIETWKKQLAQLKADYELNGCVVKVEEMKQVTVKEIAKDVEVINRARIETVSTYERNKRIFFGALVLLLALALISTNKKE
jgi:hypothetical protein